MCQGGKKLLYLGKKWNFTSKKFNSLLDNVENLHYIGFNQNSSTSLETRIPLFPKVKKFFTPFGFQNFDPSEH